MAGFSKVFCVGHSRSYDGISNVKFLILQGESDRQWLEACYHVSGLRPIGNIRIVIPAKPDDPDALLDACIAFYPEYFCECPSMRLVARKLAKATRLDFDLGRELIPAEWYRLRHEARALYARLVIFESHLQPLAVAGWGVNSDVPVSVGLTH
ncbi:MAG TPA: hypothetical protein PLU72_03020 [Candidatus Ozemobacteraceae bacterium]|nr:hypothetical protein [Candidatus Ozemobacteraceae bacterium]HQG28192.1 hypothetical protein [Candidatus Ozemobacteraceae bacterium]